MPTRRRLGLLGPIIVLVGAAVAGVAVWYMISARPKAGATIDTFAIDDKRTLLVRAEAGGNRSFLELRVGDEVKWQALIPPYAGAPGRPGVAWSDKTVTVRVERSGRGEVFAFALANAHKIGALRLAPDKGPVQMAEGPITLTDHQRSYELVGGVGWNEIVAIDLMSGNGVWKVELGNTPVRAGGVTGSVVWLQQGEKRRAFDALTGRETPDIPSIN